MKTYIKPEMDVVNITMESMIAESDGPKVFTDPVSTEEAGIKQMENILDVSDITGFSFPSF